MTEEQALEKAMVTLSQKRTLKTGRDLLALAPYISADKFGDLWSSFIMLADMELIAELNEL